MRSHLDLLRPDVAAKVHAEQSRQKKQHDQHSRMRRVEVGDSVNFRNFSRGPRWISGTIIEESGPFSARIELEDGTVVRRLHDQVVACLKESFRTGVTLPTRNPLQQEGVDSEIVKPDVNNPEHIVSPCTTQVRDSGPTTPIGRYPASDRKPPQCFY